MEPAGLPAWAQAAALIAVALVSAIVGVFKYLKTESKTTAEAGGGAITTVSFLDSKILKELIEAVRDHQEGTEREFKKVFRTIQDLRESMIENTEAVIVQTDSTGNLLKFLSRKIKASERIVDVVQGE